MKRKNRNPTHNTPSLLENCINAYVDGNKIQGIWDYLRPLIDAGEISQPYAKEVASNALDVIKSSERTYRKIIR